MIESSSAMKRCVGVHVRATDAMATRGKHTNVLVLLLLLLLRRVNMQ